MTRTAYSGGRSPSSEALPDGGELLLGATDENQGTLNWASAPASYREAVGDLLTQMKLLASPTKWTLPDDKVPEIVFGGVSADYLVRCDFQIGLVNSPTDQIVAGGIALNGDLVGKPLISSDAIEAGCLPIDCKFTVNDEYWLHAVRRVSLVSGDILSLVLANASGQDIVTRSASISFTQIKGS